MLRANSIELELPQEEALALGTQAGWIIERDLEGKRALLAGGKLHIGDQLFNPPGPVPSSWATHVIDGVLTGDAFQIFDLLVFSGTDIRELLLAQRKAVLWTLTLPAWCRHVPVGADCAEFLEAVAREGGKGVILKDLREDYFHATWTRVRRQRIEHVIVTAVHPKSRTASVAQFEGNVLVNRGEVLLGSILNKAWTGQVLEVSVADQHTSGQFEDIRFLRFRSDKLAKDCTSD